MSDFAPTARVIADSISNETGTRLTTLELTLHPYTLTQLLAHRAFSRTVNTRANISFAAQAQAVQNQSIYPALWNKDNGLTAAATPLHHTRVTQARDAWDRARDAAIEHARALSDLGVHRNIVNRLLTPFTAAIVTLTATDFNDFFEQRLAVPDPNDPLLDTEIIGLAADMNTALAASVPEKLDLGHWHLPRLQEWELVHLELTQAIHTSAARCTSGGAPTDPRLDRETYRRLFQGNPPHWSPLEHIATPAATTDHVAGNFTGWHQLRHRNPGQFA